MNEYYSRQVDLVFTSPPYWDQRPEYAEYKSLQDYLTQMSNIFAQCYRLLREGSICVVNIGQDTAVDLPSHISLELENVKFQYVDTICWNKNSEIGERGMFLKKNLYYPNYTWEPIYVYRKPFPDELMGKISDSNFPKFEERFKGAIESNYRTNLWNIRPQSNSDHPAVFPLALAKAVIMCYSGKGSKILDPFGGSGTTAQACEEIGDRIYLLIERKKEYYDLIIQNLSSAQPGLGI